MSYYSCVSFAKLSDDSMKIVIFTHYWKTSQGGGINTYIRELVDHLKHKFDINIVYTFGPFDKNNYKIPPSRICSVVLSLFYLIKVKPQVLHIHESFDFLAVAVIYKKFFRKVGVIFTFHTEPVRYNSPYKKIKMRIKKTLYTHILTECDWVTFVSKSLELDVKSILHLDENVKTTITYAGVKTKQVSNYDQGQFLKQFGLSKENIILLALGMVALKPKAEGTKILICALEILLPLYPNMILVVTRDGKYLEEVKLYVEKKGLTKNVVFTGDIINPHAAIAAANIFCQITLAEGGVSLSLLEAMSLGKAIVASSAGGIPEAIDHGKNGFLADSDPSLIAFYIHKLLSSEELSLCFGKNAVSTVNSRFRWDLTIDIFTDLYCSVGE